MAPKQTIPKDRKKIAITIAASEAATSAEEPLWEEKDKGAKAKIARAQEKEAKADFRLRAKQECKALEAAEDEINAILVKAKRPQKITQFEIAQRQGLIATDLRSASKCVTIQPMIQENVNRLSDVIKVSGVDAALGMLDAFKVSGNGKCRGKTFDEVSICSTRSSDTLHSDGARRRRR